MGWESWHLHRFKLWGKEYGIPYVGGACFADDARRVHLGEFPWRAGDTFTYTYDFGDYWQHQVRVEKLLPPTALVNHPVCVSDRRACPPEEIGGPRCIVPECDGRFFTTELRQYLWDNYFTVAPAQRRQYDAASGKVRKAHKA